MSDKYDYSPPESMRKNSKATDLIVSAFLLALLIGPPILALWNWNAKWLWGWLILLILGLAG